MKKLTVKVHPNASHEKIVLKENLLHVYVHASPEKGNANKRLVALIAEYFEVPKSLVHILCGHTSRNKVIEIISSNE